jgi:high-affinity Fe2+/Pb2+ permease
MKYLRKATTPQKWMIVLMGIAVGALIPWTVIELIGALDGKQNENTYSEWVWDLPIAAVLAIVAVQLLAGVAAIASTWHFLEGWARRRRRERQ